MIFDKLAMFEKLNEGSFEQISELVRAKCVHDQELSLLKSYRVDLLFPYHDVLSFSLNWDSNILANEFDCHRCSGLI